MWHIKAELCLVLPLGTQSRPVLNEPMCWDGSRGIIISGIIISVLIRFELAVQKSVWDS